VARQRHGFYVAGGALPLLLLLLLAVGSDPTPCLGVAPCQSEAAAAHTATKQYLQAEHHITNALIPSLHCVEGKFWQSRLAERSTLASCNAVLCKWWQTASLLATLQPTKLGVALLMLLFAHHGLTEACFYCSKLGNFDTPVHGCVLQAALPQLPAGIPCVLLPAVPSSSRGVHTSARSASCVAV
jgi:hypothetical protein